MKTPLKSRDFALLWTAGLISLAGNWMLIVAVPITVLRLTGSSAATGAVVVAAMIPRIVVGPVAGVFVDRWDRRTALVLANLASAALVLPLVLVESTRELWVVAGSLFVLGCVSQVLATAENALLPTLVPPGAEIKGNALNALNNNLARLAGPAVGGVLAAYGGLATVVLVDAGTFLLAAAMIAAIRGTHRPATAANRSATPGGPATAAARPAAALGGIWSDLVAGLREIRGNRRLRVLFRYLAIISVGEGVMAVMVVVFTERALGGGPRELGWLVSAQAIGGVIGGLAGGWAGDRVPTRWLIGGGTVLLGAGDLVIFNYPRWYPELWPALVLMAAVGVPAALLMAGVLTTLQTAVEDRMRGRVFGAALTVMAALGLVGTVGASALGDSFGPVLLLNVQGIGLVAGGLYVLRALRAPVTGVTHATERTLHAARRTP